MSHSDEETASIPYQGKKNDACVSEHAPESVRQRACVREQENDATHKNINIMPHTRHIPSDATSTYQHNLASYRHVQPSQCLKIFWHSPIHIHNLCICPTTSTVPCIATKTKFKRKRKTVRVSEKFVLCCVVLF